MQSQDNPQQPAADELNAQQAQAPADASARVAELEAQVAELKDQYLRTRAEQENQRRRAAEDLQAAHKFAVQKFAAELLPVKDSLELALADQSGQFDALKNGVDLTLKQLASAFEKFQLLEINPQGEKLDKDDKCPLTPGVAANNGCPEIKKEEQEVLNTAFSNLEFQSGKDIIKPESFESLSQLADLMKKKPEWMLKIAGHTDNQGNRTVNILLSRKRTMAVKKYLVSKGIADQRVIAEWFGPDKPIADNKTPEGREKNRRVEMEILFK